VAAIDNGDERYYAYADSTGGGIYYRDSNGKMIGSVRAYFTGLPNVWSRYVFMAVTILSIAVFFVPNLLLHRSRQRLGFFHRGMCVLLAWLMFISPEMWNQLSEASVNYSEIKVSSWGKSHREVIYEYDDNGSVIQKVTNDDWDGDIEIIGYTYDLANRLVKVITEDGFTGNKHIVEYEYNDEGIRVKSHSYDILWNESLDNEKTAVHLTDSYNHTGYSQTLEEETETIDYISGVPQTPVTQVRTYFIGDDCLAHKTNGNTQYLLYDGHGSTRQLATYSGSDVSSNQNFSYDGYGVFLQSRDLTESTVRVLEQPTSLLYAGEHFDFNAQQYYNRARWYNPLIGLFNQVDPYAGNLHDPQSLHKYLYCHANPVNGIDPSGQFFTAIGILTTITIVIRITALVGLAMLCMSEPFLVFGYTGLSYLKITTRGVTKDNKTYSVTLHKPEDFIAELEKVQKAKETIMFFEYMGHGFGGEEDALGTTERGWGLAIGKEGGGFVRGPHPDPRLAQDTYGLIFFDNYVDLIKNVFSPTAIIELEACYSAFDQNAIAYKFKRTLPKSSVYGYTNKAYPFPITGVREALPIGRIEVY